MLVIADTSPLRYLSVTRCADLLATMNPANKHSQPSAAYLDPGERPALALALDRDADLLLVDEAAGCREAE
ncbi:MAG: hypothetical protein ABI693_04580 [Bryobacteraceae bacterium]